MKTEAEFKQFFQTSLLGELQTMEIQRLNLTGKIRIFLFSGLIILTGISIYFLWIRNQTPDALPGPDFSKIFWIAGSFIVMGIIFSVAFSRLSKKYRKNFKEVILTKIIHQISKDISYFPEDKIELNDFKNSGLYKTRDANIAWYRGRDLVVSRIGDISYRFSWLDVDYRQPGTTRKMDSDRQSRTTKTSYYKLFRGIFYVADFGVLFPAHATVWPNYESKIKLGGLVKFLQDKSLGNRVELDDPDFNREYAVYGDDTSAIQKMITPGLRRWIMDFRSKTNSSLFLSFTGSKMNIAVSLRKNLFEPPIFKKVTDYNFIFENFRYMMLFNGLLEDLGRKH